MGRILWSLRRPPLYALIALIVYLIKGVSFGEIIGKAVPFSNSLSLFYSLMLWGGGLFVLFLLFSIIYAKGFFKHNFKIWKALKTFLYEDLVSPVYCFYQLAGAIYVSRKGESVFWPGIIFDLVWTIFWIAFFVINVLRCI